MSRKIKSAAKTTGAPSENQNGMLAKKPRAARKMPATRKTGLRVSRKKMSEVTDDAIRLRAYFISQDRRRHGLSSDPNSDWIEARRQLLAEIKKP